MVIDDPRAGGLPAQRSGGCAGGSRLTPRSSLAGGQVRAGIAALVLQQRTELRNAVGQGLSLVQDRSGDGRMPFCPLPRGLGAGEEIDVPAGPVGRDTAFITGGTCEHDRGCWTPP